MTKNYQYKVVIQPDDPSGYYAVVPSLPGCVTQGETIEETLTMIKDAIAGYLAVLEDEGLPIPEEREAIISDVFLERPVHA